MRVAIVGVRGQLGTDLQTVLNHTVIGLGHADIEITDRESVHAALEITEPDCVINAAAYNKVDIAEDEPEVAYAVNALGPRHLALECAARKIPLVHISTDYVFGHDNDRSTSFTETDAPEPVSAYGTSKLAGEHFVRSLCPKHYVLRTCGLFGAAARVGAGKGNFVETMLRLGHERDELRIINDQHCTPTSSLELARAIDRLIRTDQYGLYHATARGSSNWFEFALEIFRYAGVAVMVEAIPSRLYPTKARRPGYSILNSSKLESVISHGFKDWRSGLHEYLDQRAAQNTGLAAEATAVEA